MTRHARHDQYNPKLQLMVMAGMMNTNNGALDTEDDARLMVVHKAERERTLLLSLSPSLSCGQNYFINDQRPYILAISQLRTTLSLTFSNNNVFLVK